MSLTRAEQICALYQTNMDPAEIAETVGVQRAYVLQRLLDAGLRQKSHCMTHCIPQADLPPRVNRDPCTYCNVRADIGCRHTRWAA